jgi:3'-phosphoadenosine 5'-phosphosulfate sulfotransferase (PAPS reductase)/FAD synthetase
VSGIDASAPFPLTVVFASYGNDSVALIQWVYEAKLKNVYVLYSNTGWAAKWWPQRVAKMEAWARSLGFYPVKTKSVGLENLVRSRKGWPRQGLQFCTIELKIMPALQWLKEHDPAGIADCYVGVRREESQKRADFPEYIQFSPNHGDRACFAPMATFTEAQRNELLARAGVEPLPHRSKECFPCINSNRRDLRLLAGDEERIAKIEAIENSLGFTSKGKPRTMFRPYRHMGATGIRQIVKWAQSERGEFDLNDGTGQECESGYCGL